MNFYRHFIYYYSQIAGPLIGLLKGSEKGKKLGPFEWPIKAKRAFTRLQNAFIGAPLLRHFDPNLPIRLKTDASKFVVAGILTQLDDVTKQ